MPDLLPPTLTSAQREVIQHVAGPLLVIAGPGAGKTETMVRRAAYLVLERGVDPKSLLVTTFTNKAADELYDRLYLHLSNCSREIHISTIHSFCQTLLERYPHAHPWGAVFEVLDEKAQFLFIYAHLKELQISKFPKARLGEFVQGVLATFNLCTEEMVSPERFAAVVHTRGAELLGLKKPAPEGIEEYQAVADAYERYRAILEAEGTLDFAMLQQAAFRMLRDHPKVRDEVADRYRHLLVDEYQDTNRLQVELMKLVAAPRNELCAVGDDDQSIYRFRGACVSSFLRFEEDFPGARLVHLGVNFRATPPLVAASSALIGHNADHRREKNLSSGRSDPGFLPVLVHREFVAEEADEAIRVLKRWREEGAIQSYDDVALLFRSVKYHAEPYIEALERHGVPYTVVADGAFFDREDILQLKDLLTFCGWKHRWDPRFLEGKVLELRPRTVEAIRRWSEDPVAWRDEAALDRLGVEFPEERQLLRELAELRRRTLDGEIDDLLELFYELLRASRYFERCCAHERNGRAKPEAEAALLNLAQFSGLIDEFQRRVRSSGTYRFSEYLRSLPERSMDALRPERDGEALRLMTVHQAKGLEFPAVAVGSAQEGRFPGKFRRSPYPVPSDLRLSGNIDDAEEHERDQRRLFYVAMTRAQNLLLVGASDKVTKRGSGVSRFVEEVGRDRFIRSEDLEPSIRAEARGRARAPALQRISYSALHSYLLCPLQYRLLHVCGFAVPQQHWFDLGSALHRALEQIHRRAKTGMPIEGSIAEEVWRAVWRPGRSWSPRRARQLEETGLTYLRRYVLSHHERFQRVLWVEEPVDLVIGDKLQLTGRLDLVCKVDDGVEIVEFKVRTRRGLDELHPEWQVQTYGLALQERKAERVARVVIHLLAEEPGTDLEVRAWHPELADAARARLEDAAEGIQGGNSVPKPGGHCWLCDFRNLCPSSHAHQAARQEEHGDEIPIGAAP